MAISDDDLDRLRCVEIARTALLDGDEPPILADDMETLCEAKFRP
jgi:hypothetical protein